MSIVLVADDNETNRKFLTVLLGYGGHCLVEATDGADALEKVRSEHPDLVIADVLMPVMDGYEFVRELRNDPSISGTPVVFYTASYHESEARALAKSCGVHSVILKPAAPERILAVVNEALGAAQATVAPSTPHSQDFDRDHLRLLTDKLSANVNALEAANQKLADLLEASSLLASEHDGDQMLSKFCPAMRDLLGARLAFVGIFSGDGQSLKPIFVSGADPHVAANLGPYTADAGILLRLAVESGPIRVRDASLDPIALNLPESHLATRPFLGMRLNTSAGPRGMLWALEKLGAEEFSEEDEKVLASLTAQAGLAHENAQRYREIQRYASEMERCVKERTEELIQVNHELEAFNYSISHDLRAPLRHIRSYAQILSEEFGARIHPQFQQYLGYIREGADKMGELVEGLLRLSQAGRQGLSWKKTDLDSMVQQILRDFESETIGRVVEWKVDHLGQVDCDPILIRQVFANLISNAVKYTRPRSRALVEVGAFEENGVPAFFVRDNGVGFDMKYTDKLFGVFQRLHRPEDFEGAGAGLAIAQRIVHRHHGRIWVEAELEKGATFYFTLDPRPPAAALA